MKSKEATYSLARQGFVLLLISLVGNFLPAHAAEAQGSESCLPDLGLVAECDLGRLLMSDIQSVGSHNSYKLAIPEAELELIRQFNPRSAITLDYSHIGLREQLELGLRQLELDILYDPEGGRYATPLLPKLTADDGQINFDSSELLAPGFKVLHAQDLDVRSSCATWVKCLTQIRDWSDANPTHIPLLIMFNAKEGGSSFPGTIDALPFTPQAYDQLEAEILSVFPITRIITPDEIRRGRPTLREAVLEIGWLSLEESLGRIFFALDEGEEKVAVYLGENHSAQGKLIFPNSVSETADHAAYFTLNSPVRDQIRIKEAVSAGFMVRTRADANTFEARENNTEPRDAAFRSGAQYISTDYYVPREEFSDYSVRLPGGYAARCTPVKRSLLGNQCLELSSD